FRHNEQSLRIVEHLENEGHGLNLTWEVRDGILNHTWSMPMPSTRAGQVARFADRIAYVNHDLDDATRAGILQPGEVPGTVAAVLGATHAERIETLITDLVAESESRGEVTLSPPVLEALDRLRSFLFDRVYLRKDASAEQKQAVETVRERSDITQVVSGYLQLKKAGRDSLVGLCPFHTEKTASLSVSPSKQVYYCFGCGEGGNVFNFLRKIESLSFAEAVERLAD